MIRVGLLFLALLARPVWAQSVEESLTRSLEALSPDQPLAYYTLAETIADQAGSPQDIELARRLFVLSYVLGEEPSAPVWLRASSCVALASLERNPSRRRWLFAVAAILDDRYASIERDAQPLGEFSRDLRLAFSEYLGLVRAGRGALARGRLEQPGMGAIIEAVGEAVLGVRNAPSLARIRGEAGVWPCKQCSNARSVPDASDPDTKRVLCPNCRGNPGPLLTDEDRIGFVALEAIALRADGRTWSAEHAMLRTGPLLDPDPDGVAAFYQIDVERTVYNSGAWRKPGP